MGLCAKFNVQQLLFEGFSLITHIFGCVAPQIETTFPFPYNIFETYQSLEPPSSTPGVDRHVRQLTFLNGIQSSTIFI